VIKTLKNALQPAVKDVHVAWTLPKSWDVQNVPTTIPTLFVGNRLVVYGIFNRKDQSKYNNRQIVAIEGTVTITGHVDEGLNSSVIHHVIKFSAVCGNPGDRSLMLHRLCAKTTIQEKQDQHEGDIENMNDNFKIPIVELSKSAIIVSKLTSFVAVDQESHEPVSRAMERPMMPKINQDGGGRVFALCSLNKGMLGYSGPPPIPTGYLSSAPPPPAKASYGAYPPPPPPREESSKIAGRKAIQKHSKSKHSPTPPPHTTAIRYESDSLPSNKGHVDSHLALISLQKACGSWQLTAQLASICGVALDKLIKVCPSELTADNKESVWATALALSCLFGKFKDKRDEWEMVAAKGTKWLKVNLLSNNLSYLWIMDIASDFLKI
jgi:hypothetical protein